MTGQSMAENESHILIYQADDSSIKVDVLLDKKKRKFRFLPNRNKPAIRVSPTGQSILKEQGRWNAKPVREVLDMVFG